MIARLVKFAGASGVGLFLDYLVYTLLCRGGMDAGWANLISATVAVTFVFVVSARHIFEGEHRFLYRLFMLYALYQVVAVSAASYAVDHMTEVFDGRYIWGKTVVVPFSFFANYLFASWLFASRNRPVEKLQRT